VYFSFFPNQTAYPLSIVKGDFTEQYDGEISFSDFFRNAALTKLDTKNNLYFYQERILNGERPDQLSTRLYGSPNYFWTFFIINPHLRLGESLQWPLEENLLREKLAFDYAGKALISFKARYIRGFKPQLSFIKDNQLVAKQFINGEIITGQRSGATGTLSLKRNEYGQLIVIPTSEVSFEKGESIVGSTSGYSVFVHDTIEYVDAPMYYIDEEKRECSHPNFIYLGDPDLNETLYTPVSFKEHFFILNEELSKIKVLQKSSIHLFDSTYRSLIKKRAVL
jgi:hypothetical protein